MGDLPITDLKYENAKFMDLSGYEITLKRDGTLINWKDNNLVSPRGIVRNDRFKHIAKILSEHKFPNCFGEMYIDNGNVFSVSSKENWSKAKFMPFSPNLDTEIEKIGSCFVTKPIRFKSLEEGWQYVLANKEEGLVLKSPNGWFKIKKLCEAKVKIKSWESGSDKGTFILDNDNRISGTSVGFVNQFLNLQKEGKIAMAEIEFPFITDSGKFFQPRLRRIFAEGVE